jgi:hypothetical protein
MSSRLPQELPNFERIAKRVHPDTLVSMKLRLGQSKYWQYATTKRFSQSSSTTGALHDKEQVVENLSDPNQIRTREVCQT